MEEKAKAQNRWLVPALLGLVILLLAAILVVVLRGRNTVEPVTINDDPPALAYAEGTVALDQAGLQAAIDAEKAKQGSIALEYKNTAISTDGTNFTCYLANSSRNTYDVYFQIFSDADLTDQLLLTGLVRPGNLFESITLDHALDPGSHTVYVVVTQVDEDMETVRGQMIHTMTFAVGD